jgi:branched-chain amino acid transport system substrate-binding protein
MKRTSAFAAMALLAMACGGTNPPAGGSTTTGEDIVVGSPLSATGGLAKEGELAHQGYDLWLDWINSQGGINVKGVKHKVRIIYKDDTSDAKISAQLTQELITKDKVQFLLGPYGSSATATDAAIAEQNQIPMVESNGAAESIFSQGYKYTFGVLSPGKKYLQGVLDLAATLSPKPTKVAVLYANDTFSTEVAAGIKEYAPSKGMEVVFYQSYPDKTNPSSALVNQAKGANPEILLNAGHLQEAIAINKVAKDLRLNAKIFAYSVGPSTPDFIAALGKDADYVYSGSQWTPQVKYTASFYLTVPQYVAAYKSKFPGKGEPDYHVAESTAGCLALQKAIENAGSLDPKKVRDALAALDVVTFFGQIKFDSRGLNIYKPMVVEQIQNGQHHTVFPETVRDVPAKYPTPAWDQR